ncbi:MAG TPA: sialidase family protein [Rugosimonospora sp.]|nr:sialidase family protein [Rugosimonospora sp.]
MADRPPDPPPEERRIDFARLRSEVEAAVMLPGFRQVAKRARWRRARTRLATLGSVALIMGILVPAGVVADLHQTTVNGWVSQEDHQPTPTPLPSGSSVPLQVDLTAAAGVDLNHMFVLADVCAGDNCSLELFRLSGQGTNRPVGEHLLRSKSTSWLDSVALTALSDTSVLVSGLTDGDQWQSYQVDVNKSKDGPPAQSKTPPVTTADRVVQMSRYGELQAVQANTGRVLELAAQPPLVQPSVVDNLLPARGIWVTGLVANQLAVSVSRDAGRSWTTRSLGLPAIQLSSFDQPVFASYNGTDAYLLVRLADEDFALFWTADGGHTWHRHGGQLPWPQPVPVGAPFGLVVRPDGSLLAWLASSPTIMYLESTDGGTTFRVTGSGQGGPTGPVYAVPGGYIELGGQPAVSRDTASWATMPVSYAPPGSS